MTMSIPFFLACAWFVLAAVLAAIPSNDNHWRRAYFLMAIGVPILIWLGYVHGPWLALLFFCAACSFLRWPVIYLYRWIKRQVIRS